MADLSRWIEAIEAEAVVVCLDCCHAAKVIPRGGLAEDLSTRDMKLRPALLQGLSARGRYLIASCDDGQVSVEAEEWGHGLFTHHLLAGLRGAGDRDGDGRVGIAEFFEYVSEAVERDARAIGLVQKPWISATGPGGVVLATQFGKGDGSRNPAPLPTGLHDAERLWREQGSAAAVRAIGSAMEAAPDDVWIPALGLLGRINDPAGVPLVFRGLAHSSEAVRGRAKQVIRSLGWERVTAAIKDLARCGDETQVGPVLDGLAAFEAHDEIVELLDLLATLLKDNLHNRAILLLERKQQGLEFERVAALFRQSRSPYQIVKPLGQGLFAAAYQARDESNDLDVVVRVLRPEYVYWPQIRAQFLDLARRSVKLVHQNLVLTREVRDFPERRIYYAVRNYVEGVTLQRLLESGRVFGPAQILQILRQIVLALTAIHERGMVHGSIKPSNVFLCGEDRVILGDLAVPMGGIGLQVDRLSYDYRYASPEAFRRGDPPGPKSDFYSLGCLAYELACGSPPFLSDNHFELAAMHDREAAVPPSRRGSVFGTAGDALILGLLAKLPAERLAGSHSVMTALDQLDRTLRPLGAEPSPAAPILGEASLIRYTTDDMISVVSFEADPHSHESAPARRRRDEDTYEDFQGMLDRVTRPRIPLGDEAGTVDPGEPARVAPEGPGARALDDLRTSLRRYTIVEGLGRGTQGTVFRARDEELGREVAIKWIVDRSRASPEALIRFKLEARSLAQLSHPNIVSIYDILITNEFSYAVMEYVDGGDLRQRMIEGPWPAHAAARLVVTLARAVDHAHQHGILHRDLKPSNVLLTRQGVAKISDFGLAKILGERAKASDMTHLGTVVGT
jgi:serine/threonine protein kinase